MDHLDIALSIKRDFFFLLSYREKFLSAKRVAWDILAMQNFFLVYNNCQQCWLNLLLFDLVVPLLTYLLMKEDLTLEEVSGHAIDVVGAGVDTVRLIIIIIMMIMIIILH